MLKHNLIVALAAMTLLSGLSLPAKAETILDKVQNGGLNQVGQAYQSDTPRDIRFTIIDIINIALGFLGIIAVVLIVYAGFRWMTAGGNEENVAAAKKILIAGIIGLVIILSSYALANFVINQLIGATTGTAPTN